MHGVSPSQVSLTHPQKSPFRAYKQLWSPLLKGQAGGWLLAALLLKPGSFVPNLLLTPGCNPEKGWKHGDTHGGAMCSPAGASRLNSEAAHMGNWGEAPWMSQKMGDAEGALPQLVARGFMG